MSRKKTHRKVWLLINPLAHVLEGVKPLSADKLAQLQTRELSSLDALAHGRGGLREWQDMTAMLNLCEGMAHLFTGSEIMDACTAAQAELLAAAERYQRTQVMGLSASGLQALRHLFEWHDLQRTSVTLGEYEKEIARAIRIERGKGKSVHEIVSHRAVAA